MGTTKSDQEMAFLRELFVATNWGERFAALIDEHVELPEKGRMLYVVSGTGGHAMAMQERAGDDLTLTCVDESEEALELARAKAAAVKAEPEFQRAQLETLPFDDDQFDVVIADASLVAVERLPEMFGEMVRVSAPGGTVALCLVTHASYGEFFSIYWEALLSAGFEKHEHDVESLIRELPTVAAVEEMAGREGLDAVSSWTQVEEFNYESGEEFMNSPLIADFLLKAWLESLPGEEAQARVAKEIVRIIDAERQDMDFTLSVKATLIVGRKAE